MKKLMPTGLILAAALNLVATDTRDIKLLLGEWIPIKAELGGQAMPDSVLKTISLKLGQGTYDVSVAGDPDKGTYEINSSTLPKRMLIKGTDGPNKGRAFHAIYEIDGDTLRICYDLSGAQHPHEFKSVAGTRLYLVTYQRKK